MRFVVLIFLSLIFHSCTVSEIGIVTSKDLEEIVLITNFKYINYLVDNDSIRKSEIHEKKYKNLLDSIIISSLPNRIQVYGVNDKISVKSKYSINKLIELYNPQITADLIRYELYISFHSLIIDDEVNKKRKEQFKNGDLISNQASSRFNDSLRLRNKIYINKDEISEKSKEIEFAQMELAKDLKKGTSLTCIIELKDRKTNILLKSYSTELQSIKYSDTTNLKRLVKYLIDKMDF